MSTLHRLLKFAFPLWKWIGLALMLGFATVGSGVGLMMTSAFLIAKAALHPSIAVLQVAIVGVRFFGLSRGIFRYLERLVSHNVTFQLLAKLRVWFYEKLEPLAPGGLERERSGDLLSRAVADIETLENFYGRVMAPPLVALLTAGLMMLLLGPLSWPAALTFLGWLAAAGILLPWAVVRFNRHYNHQLIGVRSALHVYQVDMIQGLGDLLIYGGANDIQTKIHRLQSRFHDLQSKQANIQGWQEGLTGFCQYAAVVSALWLAIPSVSVGVLDGVYLTVIAFGILAAFEIIPPLEQAALHLESSRAAGERLFEMVDRTAPIAEPAAPIPIPDDPVLTFQHVSFTYPGSSRPAIKNMSFQFPPGKKLAIVGASGAGKSTLVQLLLRFRDWDSGDILLNDMSFRQFHSEALRSTMAVLSQNTYLFNGTLRENLRLANPAATQEELEDAMVQNQLWEFVMRHPEKMNLPVGEQGLRLSGGERQRLALARCLLQNRPVMVLDEPTNGLDSITEAAFLTTLFKVARNKRLLLITHRLKGLANFDEIVVLSKGQVVERGNEHELLRRHGHYYALK
ncbi:MAG: thiol reductant ABC exporter subunit CydC, partial [Candidatus Marinimicrobia bacterium]|nr:thiol reductant ABC exporter subunit CydC [Candidatus Neomarinimicrobiota bacterium]